MKEFRVLAHCRGVPSKDLLLFSIHHRHDLRRVFCSPLGEEMADLKIFDPAGLAEIDPLLHPVKTETVISVFYPHVQKLGRRPLYAYRRVKSRSKERRQDHIASPFDIFFQIIGNDLPVLL